MSTRSDNGAREPVRVGVIGVGQIGKQHLATYQTIDGAEVVAIADIDEPEARRVAAAFGVPNVYTDFRALLQRDDIQAVDVCLHNNLHMPVTVEALQAGKDVFCEKPMAGAYCDAERMYRTAEALGRCFSIQLSTLFSSETKAARALIDAGQLGRPYFARSTGFRRRGRPYVDGYGAPAFVQKHIAAGGAMYDMAVYHIANILYLLDNPDVLTITGKLYQETEIDPARKAASGYDVEELGMGFVRMAGNICLDIIEAWAIHLGGFEGSYVVGTEGGVQLQPFGYFRNVGDLDLNSAADLTRYEWRIHNVRENGDAYDSPQHHWIAALQGRVPLLPTAALALNTMLIAEGIVLSDALGREVTAGEVKERSCSTSVTL